MTTRGPDDAGLRRREAGPLPFGVAHRRLSILDLSEAGAQPMHDPESGVTLVYNGELYNSPSLRAELRRAGHRFRSTSDTEVLLRGVVEWGDGVLDRIEGIFSFAAVDERRGTALLARDRLGVKPLYWAHHEGTVLAGSTPRSLLTLQPALADDLDRVALAQYLSLLWVPHPRTLWRSITKLPPGHALRVQGSDVEQWCYWRPPEAGPGALDPGDLLAAVRAATDRQLLSDVEVGLLFSGGLDSTLLLSLLRPAGWDGPPLHALTAGYDERAQRLELVPDDTRYAREVATRRAGVRLTEVLIDVEPERDLDLLAPHFDDPVADPAAVSLFRLCQAGDEKVLLSGVGGEELWAGYPRHANLGLGRRAAALPVAMRSAGERLAPLLFGARPGPAYGPRRNLQKLLRAVGGPRRPHYWRMMAQLTHRELAALVPDAADAAADELDAQSAPLAEAGLADALAFDRAQFLPNLNLAYVDKASMASSVEVRVPLLDELVATPTMLADPAGFIVGDETKAPLRAAARGLVTDRVIDRPKSGFGGPARAWFQGPGGSRLAERIDAAADAGLVDGAAARAVWRSAAEGRTDAALAAWALVCLHAWWDSVGNPAARR